MRFGRVNNATRIRVENCAKKKEKKKKERVCECKRFITPRVYACTGALTLYNTIAGRRIPAGERENTVRQISSARPDQLRWNVAAQRQTTKCTPMDITLRIMAGINSIRKLLSRGRATCRTKCPRNCSTSGYQRSRRSRDGPNLIMFAHFKPRRVRWSRSENSAASRERAGYLR